MTSTKFELRLFGCHREKMNVSWSVFVKRHRLEKNIVVVIIHLLGEVNDLVYASSDFEGVWVHLLTYLALESLPVEGAHVLVLGIWWLLLLLSKHPVLQALEVDQAHSTLALAGNDQWIGLVFLRTPTNSALNIVLVAVGAKVLHTSNLLSFLQFLVVKLLLTHHDLIALEVLDSEADSSKFDGVKFLNLVIVLSGFVFQRPCYKPQSIHAFLFLVGSCSSMVQVVALSILFEKAEASSIWIGSGINNVIGFVKVDLIIIAYYLTLGLGLQTHLDDVTRLVVEETVRVSQPWYGSEEYTKQIKIIVSMSLSGITVKKLIYMKVPNITAIGGRA